MKLNKLLCKIGIHSWEEKTIAEWPGKYSTTIIEGDVCKFCGKHRYDTADAIRRMPFTPKGNPRIIDYANQQSEVEK